MTMANPLDQLTTYTAENPNSLTASVERRNIINPAARRLNTVVAASSTQVVPTTVVEETPVIGEVTVGTAELLTIPVETLEAFKQEIYSDYIQPLADVIANLESFGGDLEGTVSNAQIRAGSISIRELAVEDGTIGQVLATDGEGNLQFVDGGTGGGGGGITVLPTASATVLGGVKIGSNITITNGVISVAAPFSGVYNDLTSKPTLSTGNLKTVAVSGQNSIVLAQDDTLTLVAGNSVTLTTNTGNKSITIDNTRKVRSETSGLGATYGLDCTLYNTWLLTLTAGTATTINVAAGKNPIAGIEYEMRIYVTYKSSSSVTWNLAGLKWPNGVNPAQTGTADKTDVFAFITLDGGSVWWGTVIGQNF